MSLVHEVHRKRLRRRHLPVLRSPTAKAAAAVPDATTALGLAAVAKPAATVPVATTAHAAADAAAAPHAAAAAHAWRRVADRSGSSGDVGGHSRDLRR